MDTIEYSVFYNNLLDLYNSEEWGEFERIFNGSKIKIT